VAASKNLYRAEPTDALIIEPLDLLTLIYQRRSGITHMVSEPVPQMLSAMGADAVDAATLTQRLSADFDVGEGDAAIAVIAERLEELADLGLVERIASA
jgi:PqqD family protein of HPr-rel-A system